MNEYERRVIDLALNHANLMAAIGSIGSGARIEPYVYSGATGSSADPLIAVVARQIVIPIQADSHFVISYVSAVQVLAGNPIFMVTSQGEIQITDTGNGSTLYNRAQPAGVIMGGCDFNSSGLPLLLTVPRIVLPNTNIKIDYTHRGANSDGFQIAFFGTRVYTQ
jgi:hypothetical protein